MCSGHRPWMLTKPAQHFAAFRDFQLFTQARVFHQTERSRILEVRLSPPISQHWIKQNLLPPTRCCLSLTTKTTCQSLPTQKPLEFPSKGRERHCKISQAHQAQIATIPFKLSAVVFFEISGWIRWEVRELGISCTKNMPQIKTRKFCSSSLVQHFLARTVNVSGQKL